MLFAAPKSASKFLIVCWTIPAGTIDLSLSLPGSLDVYYVMYTKGFLPGFRWNFPSRYFTHEFTISSTRKALFVFLETNALCTEEALDDEQLAWFKTTLEESKGYHAVR